MRVPRVASVLSIVWTLAMAGSARADYADRVGFMFGGGAYKLAGGGSDHTTIGPWATTGVRFTWTRNLDVEASYRYGHNFDDSKSYKNRTTGADLGLVYNGMPDSRWTWQVFGGTGVFWWNVMDFRAVPDPADPDDPFVPPSGTFDTAPTANGFREDGNAARLLDSNFKAYLGLGAETELFANMTFRAGVRLDYLIRQYTDNTGASDTLRAGLTVEEARARVDANDLVGSAFAAITYWVGKRDRDGDGLIDRDDGCPDDPEDLDGYQDLDGCPDPDNDQDGVLDAADKCPVEAEDKDGFEDEDGCPDLDNDKDTVLDAVDRCPLEPEDLDQFQDDDGCPDPDNDNDGVSDDIDQCPDTPPGVRVDGTGCPYSARELELIETGMIRVSAARFDTGKATIKPEFMARLDSAVTVLQRYPTIHVEIGGHTDSQGSEASNQDLSQRRAQAVLDYLQSRDSTITPDRYSVRGYGESVPISDNSTESGRMQNRRVEFKVTNRAELDSELLRRSTPAPRPVTPAAPPPAPATPAPATPTPPDSSIAPAPEVPAAPPPDTPKP